MKADYRDHYVQRHARQLNMGAPSFIALVAVVAVVLLWSSLIAIALKVAI